MDAQGEEFEGVPGLGRPLCLCGPRIQIFPSHSSQKTKRGRLEWGTVAFLYFPITVTSFDSGRVQSFWPDQVNLWVASFQLSWVSL